MEEFLMKRIIAVLMLLTLVIGLFSGCSQNEQEATEQVIKIGVFEPFTGKNASGGKQEALGIAYANSLQPTVTINGTTYNVELIVSDNESSKEKAPTAATTAAGTATPPSPPTRRRKPLARTLRPSTLIRTI